MGILLGLGERGYLCIGHLTCSGENGQEREGGKMRQTAYLDWFRISFAVTMECLGFCISFCYQKRMFGFLCLNIFNIQYFVYKSIYLKLIGMVILNTLQILWHSFH